MGDRVEPATSMRRLRGLRRRPARLRGQGAAGPHGSFRRVRGRIIAGVLVPSRRKKTGRPPPHMSLRGRS